MYLRSQNRIRCLQMEQLFMAPTMPAMACAVKGDGVGSGFMKDHPDDTLFTGRAS